MIRLDADKYTAANSDIRVVVRGVEYTAPQLSFRQAVAYQDAIAEHEAKGDGIAIARMQCEAVCRRLHDPDGQPVDREIVENLPGDTVAAIFDFFLLAVSRKKGAAAAGLPAEMVEQAEKELEGYIEDGPAASISVSG